MNSLSADEVITFARGLEGATLATLDRKSPFMLQVRGNGIEIIPESTKKPRLVPREIIQRVCDEYTTSKSKKQSHYKNITFNASYIILLIERLRSNTSDFKFPEEIVDVEVAEVIEGALHIITVNAYERNAEARRQCIEAFGTSCSICNFNFGKQYGELAEGYIHVHHLRPLSEIGGKYTVNPRKDLRPVCPNCHAVLHLGGECRSITEVKQLLKRNRT
jgi:5-methylcytosine-specific restriction protein A